MKTQLFYSYERIGCQRLYLNQQFIDEPVYVTEIGLDNEEEQRTVLPLLLQAGEYLFDVLPMSESLNRSEKRAEASSLFQVAAQSQAICAASGRRGTCELQRDLLEAYDKQNPDRFLSKGAAWRCRAGSRPAGPAGAAAAAGRCDRPAVDRPGRVTVNASVTVRRDVEQPMARQLSMGAVSRIRLMMSSSG
jgi:hypothetical protein